MTDRENNNLGEEIQDIVQTAVNTMDFKELNNEITTTINTALSEVRQALGLQMLPVLHQTFFVRIVLCL